MVLRFLVAVSLLLVGCSDDQGVALDDDMAPESPDERAGERADAGTTRVDAAVKGPGGRDARAAAPAVDGGRASEPAADAALSPAPVPPVLDDSLRISWSRCDSMYECAVLEVPVDYRDAALGTLSLALKRRTARGARIGSLLINPGGPGASGNQALVDMLPGMARLNERFDIVGFDPRGVGMSTPLDCHDTLQTLIATDPTPDSDAEWATLDQVSQRFADDCKQKYEKLLPHLGTQNVARDLDRIRAGLGEDKLSYLGFSYGTSIGAWYAELFPGRVRALVLDGAVSQQLSSLDLLLEQARGFELALSNYFAWCTARTSRCAWMQGKPAAQAFDSLQARIEATTLPAPGYDRRAGPGEFALAVIVPLYGGEQGWQLLSQALLGALRGDGSLLVELADAYLQRDARGEYGNITELNYAVNCVDNAQPDYAAVRAAESRFQTSAPRFGVASLGSLLVCSHWAARGVDAAPPTGQGAPPIVVIGTVNDPATPYAWAESLASELSSGVLLTWEGEGHTAYTRGSRCIDAAVESYFIDLTVPAAGKRCAASAALQLSPRIAAAALRKL
jgi:pimeloyl-ACP methyl ester carboxylesterase